MDRVIAVVVKIKLRRMENQIWRWVRSSLKFHFGGDEVVLLQLTVLVVIIARGWNAKEPVGDREEGGQAILLQ
jgi:hypothetical protein